MKDIGPKVSIVLPVYNGTAYLKRSMDSCLNQTYQNIELIIVDDCSTDDTPAVIKSYRDPRVRHVRNATNQRLPRSLNIGFRAATGEYLTWTSDDNFYRPEAIAKMVEALQKTGKDFVYADIFAFHDDRWQGAQYEKLHDPSELDKSDCVRACFLYTRKVLETVGEYDPDMELIEDYDYWVRVSRRFEMLHLPEPLYYYRYHGRQLYSARYGEIRIIEFLFKVKYDFVPLGEAGWYFRRFIVEHSRGWRPLNLMLMKWIYKPRLDEFIGKYKAGNLSFTAARQAIHDLLKNFRWKFSRKHFVILRQLPSPPKGEWGGMERLLMDWLRRVDYRASRVTVVITTGWKDKLLRELNGLPVDVVEFPYSLANKASVKFADMFRLLKKLRADRAVFFQSWLWEFAWPEILAGFLVTKNFAFMHENLGAPEPPVISIRRHFGLVPGPGLWWRIPRWATSVRALMCRRIITVSREIKDRLVSLWGYPPGKIRVCYHGVDTDVFCPSAEKRATIRGRLDIGPEETVIVMAVRLTEQKRVDRAIEAFDRLSGDFPHVRLLITGDGPLESELKTLAGNKPCASRIRFLGHVDNVADTLKAGDISVLSSDNEGFGIALVEAMATGLICVATSCPGPNELIQDGTNGFLVEKSAAGLEEGLRKILNLSGKEREAVSRKAVEWARDNFGINGNIKKVFDVMQLDYLGKP